MKFEKLDPIFGDRDDSHLYKIMQLTTAFTCGYCYGKLAVWLVWIVPGEWFKSAIALILLAGIGAFYLYCKSAFRFVFASAAAGLLIGAVVMNLWIFGN
jgi:hypothetical protein